MSQAGCSETEQTDVIAFLSDPASFGNAGPVSVRTTHGALVFLVGGEAYKIKRAVRYPYMDLSTRAARRDMCRREVDINRRFAAGLYRGVVAITRDGDGSLHLGGEGDPVEWAVQMRRFPDGCLLSDLADQGRLTAAVLDDVADSVARAYAGLDARRTGDPVERISRDAVSIAGELDGAAELAADGRRLCASLRDGAIAAADMLRARAQAGHVRRCHGDLHLGNVIVEHGTAMLFDAVEFDDDIATVDTLSDLAFLLMDLIASGHAAAANHVLNRYLWRRQDDSDLDGLGLLALFIAHRAGIRAMVAVQRARANGGSVADREAARRYLTTALDALVPRPARVVAVGGLSGTGKSTLAQALAWEIGCWPGAVVLRSDLERKAMYGQEPAARLDPASYTPASAAAVYARLLDKASRGARAGATVIVDAVFAQAGERLAIANLAKASGKPFTGLWLTAPADVLLARVGLRVGDASDADAAVVRRQLAQSIEVGEPGWVLISAAGSAAETLGRARTAISST